MFFTGYSRAASELLDEQHDRTERGDAEMVSALEEVRVLGTRIREALEAGDTERFARLMHEHWLGKKRRSGGMSNPQIDRWYDVGVRNGAIGGKLVGAGGGGFLLFYANDLARLRAAMAAEGLIEVRFGFDHDGSTVIVRE